MEEPQKPAKKRQPHTGLPDKDSLYLSWLETEESVQEFCARIGKDIKQAKQIETIANNYRWVSRRKKLMDRALSRVENGYVAEIVEDWNVQRDAWKRIEEMAVDLMGNIGHSQWCKKDCKIEHRPTAKELVAIATALEKSLDARRLLLGKKKNPEDLGVTHSMVVQMLQLLKSHLPPPIDVTPNG
jgi:hypothetical protein